MKKINFLFIYLITIGTLVSQMYILDPQSWWQQDYASIDKVSFKVQPAGLFAEVSVDFELSTMSPDFFNPDTQLEFVMDFRLDENIVFNDSWLYIDHYISYGEIYERNYGTQIYESIVDRRSDPSILTKLSDRDYELRVYPLFPDSTRRVRLSYLAPLDISGSDAAVDIGIQNILGMSGDVPKDVTIEIVDNHTWTQGFLEDDNLELVEESTDSRIYKLREEQSIPAIQYQSQIEGQYFGTYESDGEKYFQLMYDVDLGIEKEPTYNLFVIDHHQGLASASIGEIVDQMKAACHTLDETDFFNVMYFDFVTEIASEEWIPANEENINQIFRGISENNVISSSRLSSLIPEALNFIGNQNQDAQLFLFSSGEGFNAAWNSDEFLAEIESFYDDMNVVVNFDIIDYEVGSRFSTWEFGERLYGNEYLYRRLSVMFSGNYYPVAGEIAIKSAIQEAIEYDYGVLSEFDLDIDPQSGITYGNYMTNGASGLLQINEPIMVTGKFKGEMPFEFDFKFFKDGVLYDQSTTIDSENLSLNYLARSAWHANYLLENEDDSELIRQVVDVSTEERLLCKRTVFLCLEDEVAAQNGNGQVDDTVIVSTDDETLDLAFSAYPNPFRDALNIELAGMKVQSTNDLSVRVFTMTGVEVADLSDKVNLSGETATATWLPYDLEPGMYLIRIRIGDRIMTKKVIYLAQ